MRTPKWARVEEEDSENAAGNSNVVQPEDEEAAEEADALSTLDSMTRSTGRYTSGDRKTRILTAQNSTAQRLRDVTLGYSRKSPISCVKFHPSRPVLVTSTQHGTLSLFEIAEDAAKPVLKPNGQFFLQDAKFKCQLQSFHFCDKGNTIFAVPVARKHCYTYDLIEGKTIQINFPPTMMKISKSISKAVLSADGTYVAYLVGLNDLHVFVLATMEYLHTFRAEAEVADFCFSTPNRNVIYAISVNGVVYLWNLHRKAEQMRFVDDGCVVATNLALSANEQFVACGSNTGIINVYDASKVWDTAVSSSMTANASEAEDIGPPAAVGSDIGTPKPLYTLSNLTTATSFITFNHDAQLMAFGSDVKEMSMRLLHCRSGSVYANFPTREEMFAHERITTAAFSPGSAFMAFGGNSGQCRLYRLNHFSHY